MYRGKHVQMQACTDASMYRGKHVQRQTRKRQACTDASMYRCKHVQMQACTDASMYRGKHVQRQARKRQACTDAQTRAQAYKRVCGHTNACADIQLPAHMYKCTQTYQHKLVGTYYPHPHPTNSPTRARSWSAKPDCCIGGFTVWPIRTAVQFGANIKGLRVHKQSRHGC